MAEIKSVRDNFRDNFEKDVMIGEGEDGKLVSFPLSELDARTKERDRVEAMSDEEFAEYLDEVAEEE